MSKKDKIMKEKVFKTTVQEGFKDGFQMTFGNGFTISVQFSKHTYCDEGYTTAEVAVWKGEDWFILDNETRKLIKVGVFSDVMCYCTPEDVAYIMGEITKQ